MYSAPYGYGNAAGQPYNGGPQGQNPQMQPGPGPNQPQQQMMYNQQYPMGPGGAFPGAPNPGAMMPGGAGPAGMMQNTAMPQMGANGQMAFQAPFTSSPYGPNIPSTTAPPGQFNPNHMMANHMGGYPASPAGMTPQQQQQQMMMQRMQQAQQGQGGMGTPTHQRQFSAPQGTPNPGPQSQFGTPQNPQGTPQNQTPTPAPPSATSVTTPQTPTFPPPGQGPSINGNSTPASPGTQARDQERLSLLLDINMDLLYEVVHLKHTLDEIKREATMATTPEQQKEKREEEAAFNQDYVQIFRRLQANLSYLAQLTTNKADVSRQPAPAYLTAPSFNLKLKFRPMPAPGSETEKVDGTDGREEREKFIKEQYQKLHALFPGIDPTKEPTFRPMARPPHPGMVGRESQQMGHMQMQGNSVPSPSSSAHHTTPQMATLSGPPSSIHPSTSA